MKKRWFAIALTLCLTLALMTVTAEAKPVKYGCQIDPENYPDLKTFPATYIALSASVPSADTCDNALGASINVHSLQYPVDGNYHKMVLKLSIPSHKCETCLITTGPFNDLTVTFESDSDEYFCHSYNHTGNTGDKILKLTSSAQTESGDKIDFEILVFPKNRNGLKYVSKIDPTCTEGGISQDCYYCDVCDKYFSDAEGKNEIDTPVISALGHDFDKETGQCSRCDVRATASLNDEFKESLAAAVEDYNHGNGGVLRAFVTPEGDASFTLKESGTLIVPAGVTIPKIVLEEGPAVTIENAGTIRAIETSPVGTLTINNSGTVGAIQMNPAGTLTVDNSGEIASIKTPIRITGGGTRTLGITNHSSGVIEQIEAPNTMITVQNDGTIGELTGYFYPDDEDTSRENMVTLKRGAGVYTKIQSVGPWPGEGYATKTADYSKLLSDGDYFYFPGKTTPWQRGGSYDLTTVIYLNNVYFTGLPIDSVDVTGAANGTSLEPTRDDDGSLSMTVEVGQTVALTGGFTVPTSGLKSNAENISYSWRCKHADSTTSGNRQSYTLEDIQYGTYELTLTVTDSQYHYTKSLTFYLYAEQPEGQKTQICLKTPTGTFTKKYDATTRAPGDLKIEFYDKSDNPIMVPEDCYKKIVAYKDPNCSDNNEITATVSLTEKGAQVYDLGTDGTATFTVPATITRAGAVYQLSQTEVTARVGEHVFPCLALTGTGYLSDGNHGTNFRDLFGTVSIEQDIMVEGAPLSITFYRLHPGNITNRGRYSTISHGDFIHDPSMNEELTADSTFAAAGEYYVYAVVQPTRNYKPVEETTSCIVIQVQETEDSAKHHEGAAAWDGTTTVPIATGETKSVYLSGALPNVSTELLLSREKKLTLCLNGKTLSATNSITSYNHIRVTDNAALTIVDCTGTGVVKGTVPATVNGGAGGIAYVADGGTITIKGGKLTGGVASTGGAIVVDAGGILNIEGGEISGNLVQTGNGGAIYVKKGGVVNMTGGKIRGNQVVTGNGGAIYVEAGGTVNLFGGTISGNTAGGLGGGIYVEEGGTLNVQGAPVVTGNTAGGKENNVYLPAGQRIAITENGLNSDAEIGVTSESGAYPVLIANAAQDASAQFTADDKNAAVIWLNSALSLVQKPAVAAAEDESTVTVSVGKSYLPDSVVIMLAEYAENGQLVRVQTATVAPEQGEYTFQRTAGTWVRCFLLRQDHTPLTPALAPRV